MLGDRCADFIMSREQGFGASLGGPVPVTNGQGSPGFILKAGLWSSGGNRHRRLLSGRAKRPISSS
jgi:hypothetical protein